VHEALKNMTHYWKKGLKNLLLWLLAVEISRQKAWSQHSWLIGSVKS
jgi:hypothetical protein